MAAAIVSLACRYPDAETPEALWRNVREGRRAFRDIPPERLELAHYAAEIVGEADSITAVKAGLLTDWQFDCARFRIPQATFEAADLTHWLALEVAAGAIAAAGGPQVLDRDRTAVVVANTLAGEFSRAALLRLRAPFLEKLLARSIGEIGLDGERALELRQRFNAALREHFPTPNEETLAGGLANTIAGRIANYFDLHGGAYSVDAACASSLVALADAANLLATGRVDMAIVGAVDLSLDPFELIGFSRNGALARTEMRVFDARSSGFWPGEGAAFLLLVREEDARSRGLPVRAILRGCGMSSDGAGGLTRPTVEGQLLALRRAYEAAAVDPAEVGYVEAHGTGTAVGDVVEVKAIACLRNGAARPLPIGSIKANFGHAKAAAGFAGLVKTIGLLSAETLPPHVSCLVPHPVFRETQGSVRPATGEEMWPDGAARLAGISSFGFGGINAHVVLEGNADRSRALIRMPSLHRPQDAELFAFSAPAADLLRCKLAGIRKRVGSLSLAEFTDLAAACATEAAPEGFRAAIVAKTPGELAHHLDRILAGIAAGRECLDPEQGAWLAGGGTPPRIGFLFPGQAAPSRPQTGLWKLRFDFVREFAAAIPAAKDPVATEVAQVAIAAASLAGLRVLAECNVEARIAAGHSLGEIAALAWSGALGPQDLLRLAAIRGAVMAGHARPGGAMLRVAASPEQIRPILAGLELTIACHNGPAETVLSGPRAAIAAAHERARRAGLETTQLAVSHAFHSSMMQPAIAPFARSLSDFTIRPLERTVISTVTGTILSREENLRDLLVRQLAAPVLFEQALGQMAAAADVLIEVGPGCGLTRLASRRSVRAVSVDAFADTLSPLLGVLGLLFALGTPIRIERLFHDRPTRSIDLDAAPRFLASPCGRRGGEAAAPPPLVPGIAVQPSEPTASQTPPSGGTDVLALVRKVITEETGFAGAEIGDDDRFLDDLHLNSLAVSRIAAKAARLLSCATPSVPTEMAKATPRELAAALGGLAELGPEARREPERIPGVRSWLRTFAVRWRERPPAGRPASASHWRVVLIGESRSGQGLVDLLGGRPGTPDAVLVWLGDDFEETATAQLFAACRTAWADSDVQCLAICHAGAPVSAFARSLMAEERFRSVMLVERPPGSADITRVIEEIGAECSGFREVRLDAEHRCFEPEFALATPAYRRDASIGPEDVVLVTGGAKGIGAECALRIAGRTGAALILAGRSSRDDREVSATLDRAAAAGIRCRYAAADVCDPRALHRAVAAEARQVGAVTALIHAAGVNDPTLFHDISNADLARVLSPKTIGLRAAIAAAGPRLRRLVTFGSILGRIGLRGEAHYAIANAWQSAIAEQFARQHPACAVLSLEWSLWNGLGMGHRLGSLERLAKMGVDALPVEAALDVFESLFVGGAVGSYMATSRFGPPWHVSLGVGDLPLLRFLDRTLVHYPGVELVIETTLSLGRDPYLADHRLEGTMVLPAVMALEAMAQAASALAGRDSPGAMEAVSFSQAIQIGDEPLRIRIMALAADSSRIEVAIRAEHDAFATDCMRATFRFGDRAPSSPTAVLQIESEACIDAGPLYGPLLFQGDRFRSIRWFTKLSARRIGARLAGDHAASWFSAFEPQRLVLGDPAARDALLHALQAAVPQRRVIPVSVRRIALHHGDRAIRLDAIEQRATADMFEFDIVARDAAGRVVEEWQGVVFRAIADVTGIDRVLAAAPGCCAAYLERAAREALADASIEVALVIDSGASREQRRTRALSELGLDGGVFARSDGKPIVLGDDAPGVSIAHLDGVTLAVRAAGRVGCDLAPLADWSRPDSSLPLPECAQRLAAELRSDGEPSALAAARVWSAWEAALKSEDRGDTRVRPRRSRHGNVVVFDTAAGRTVTIHTPSPIGAFVVAIAAGSAQPLVPALVLMATPDLALGPQ